MHKTAILPLIALLASCAAEPSPRAIKYQAEQAAKLEKALVGYTPGKPQSCVDLRDLDETGKLRRRDHPLQHQFPPDLPQ